MSAPVAIVTGGAGALGVAIATTLLDDGFRVALFDRRGAADAADRLARTGEAIGVEADVSDEESVRAAVERVDTTWGRWTRWSTTPASSRLIRWRAWSWAPGRRRSTST
ncbi:hypothetical protein SVIO_111670 [Streptomyces violaceusniger]|uniref:Uncharacterized protein n=1 Tax=Streptomyces violaceusniger TaxID=68280 RepID=A0A4D4LJA7_STRVO|nr:hypothetical protein SVIO_111670 [Streptomyces violaceusniger]